MEKMEALMKLQVIARGLLRDMSGDPSYPFTTWEQQYVELKEQYEAGNLSDGYIQMAWEAEQP